MLITFLLVSQLFHRRKGGLNDGVGVRLYLSSRERTQIDTAATFGLD